MNPNKSQYRLNKNTSGFYIETIHGRYKRTDRSLNLEHVINIFLKSKKTYRRHNKHQQG